MGMEFQEYNLFVSMLPGLKLVQLIWAAARGRHKWQDDICNWTINFISGIFYRIRDDTLQTWYNLIGCLAWHVVSMLLALKLDQLIRAAARGKHGIHTYIHRNTVWNPYLYSQEYSTYSQKNRPTVWNPYLYSQEYRVDSIPVFTGIQFILTGKQTYSMESSFNFNRKDPIQ